MNILTQTESSFHGEFEFEFKEHVFIINVYTLNFLALNANKIYQAN